jgi:hypothetical protein
MNGFCIIIPMDLIKGNEDVGSIHVSLLNLAPAQSLAAPFSFLKRRASQ